MKLQSKYVNHTFMVKSPTYAITPYGRENIPGLIVRFEGPQRIFDSEHAAETLGWTDEERAVVEKKLLANAAFMTDYFPAPGEKLDERAQARIPANKLPTEARRRCLTIGYEQGNLLQCEKEPTAGRDYCQEHDPETTRIKTGGGTTAG